MTNRKLLGFISTIFLIIAALTLLAACGQSTPTTPAQPSTSAAAPAASAAPAKTSAPAPASSAAPAATSAPASAAAAGKTWNLRFASDTPQGGPKSNAEFAWAKSVETATNGRVKVTVFAGATLCSLPDTVTAIQNGIADLADAMTGVFPGAYPLTEVITLPFLGTNAVPNGKILWQLSQEFPAIQSEYNNFKLIGLFCTDAYRLATVNKPVRALADLNGLKLRAAGGPPTDMTKALGAVPMMISMPDTYLSLQKGTIDGIWWNYDSCVSFKQYEVTKYMTDIPTSAIAFWMIMNKDTWNSFPPDVQQQVMSVGGEKVAESMGMAWDGAKDTLAAQLKKENYTWPKETISLPADELDKWLKVGGKPVWDSWVTKWSSKGPTQQMLDKALKLKGQVK
jgi:TRAP-type transport system periplasmic protein